MPAPDTDTDRSVADAIDRVLEAEQATAAAITAAEASARAVIEAARDERRRTLERTRQRITRLHERAQVRLAQTLAHIDASVAEDASAAAIAPDVTARVLENVAARLARESTP